MRTFALDASAVMGYLRSQRGSDRTEQLLIRASDGQVNLIMSVINWGEVYAALFRSHGRNYAEQRLLEVGRMAITLCDVDRNSAKLAATFVGRFALPYADSFAAALAVQFKATLVTSDADFERVKHEVRLLRLA